MCVPVHLGDTHCTCFPKYGFLWTHLPLKCFTFSQHKQNRKWEDPALPYPYGKCGKQGSDSLSFSDHYQRLMCVREIDTHTHTHTQTLLPQILMIVALFSFLSKNQFLWVALHVFSNFHKIHQKKQKNMPLHFTMPKLPCIIIASHCLEDLHRCSVCHSG
jgi:hypothetical protein